MAMEYKYGKMGPNMKVIGDSIKLVVMESSGMWMEMSSKGNGWMIRLMAMVFMSIRMELDMKENGRTICSMAKVKRSGLIILCTRGIIMRVKNMVRGFISGRTGPAMTVTGMRTE